MDSDNCVSILENLDDYYPWCEDISTMEVYVISSYGLYECSSMSMVPIDFESPYNITEYLFKEIRDSIDSGKDLQNYEEFDVEMVKAECSSGVDYYRWNDELVEDDKTFYNLNEMIIEIADSFYEHGTPIPWDDIGDPDYWCSILEQTKKGQLTYSNENH